MHGQHRIRNATDRSVVLAYVFARFRIGRVTLHASVHPCVVVKAAVDCVVIIKRIAAGPLLQFFDLVCDYRSCLAIRILFSAETVGNAPNAFFVDEDAARRIETVLRP